jgi:phosphotransacetylase
MNAVAIIIVDAMSQWRWKVAILSQSLGASVKNAMSQKVTAAVTLRQNRARSVVRVHRVSRVQNE